MFFLGVGVFFGWLFCWGFFSFFKVFKAINVAGKGGKTKKKKKDAYMGSFELPKKEDNMMFELKHLQVYF